MTHARTVTARLLCAFLVIAIAGCADDSSPELRDRLTKRLSTFTSGEDAVLAMFYANRSYRPYWLSSCDELFSPEQTCAARLLEQLRRADRHGLKAEDYRPDELGRRLNGIETTSHQIDVELMLSETYLQYAADLSRGRLNPRSVSSAWLIPRPSFDPAAALALLAQWGPADVDAKLEPQSPEYRRLAEARSEMAELVASGGWPAVEYEEVIEPGDLHAALPTLRKRLAATGELAGAPAVAAELSGSSLRYEKRTENAVRRFQGRHGLEVDGVLGHDEREMLNVPAEDRLAQIDLNLERLRWLGETDGRRVLVNLASFQLLAVSEHKPVLKMPVIVGETQTATPSFADRVEYIEINPYWNIPDSIVTKEIAPRAAEDPDYLRKRNMEVIDSAAVDEPPIDPAAIDWRRYTNPDTDFPYAVRQRPGKGNALGRIKFIFPNAHAIYLHDTPSAELFERAKRTFSHGCIRVQNPLGLAEFLLANSSAWSGRRVRTAIDAGQHERIVLRTPVPIVMYYLTAWADEKTGELHFRRDVYGHDLPLGRALALATTDPG